MGRAVKAESIVAMRQQAYRREKSLRPQTFEPAYIRSITINKEHKVTIAHEVCWCFGWRLR